MAANVRKASVQYPEHHFNPEDILNFVEFPIFSNAWESLGLNDEGDLATLQVCLMVKPKSGAVIPGTGGVRKLRYSPSKWKRGKRGALRILYAYLEEFKFIVLVYVYDKSHNEDIDEEDKKALAREVERTREYLASGKIIS